ncbi:MAG: Radical domain protein [Herbinix sp.]|jgi:radical SAM superfamily enzyme YgiQ (UPF0313 family)|nr:Radical domain protein [Herbinix sp.]
MKALFIIPEVEFLGIEALSALMLQNGINTKLVFDPVLFDDMFLKIPWLAKAFDSEKAVIQKVVEYNPDVILFTLVSDIMPWFKKRAAKIKEIIDVPIIAGGIHATSVPDRLIKLPYVDYVVTGEGEENLLTLLKCISEGRRYEDIDGIFYKHNGEVYGNLNKSLLSDLSKYPIPDKELYYSAAPWATKEYNIVVSRGCPNRCSFCHNNLVAKMWDGKGTYVRHRTVDNAIKELVESKKKYNFTTLRFWDDNLLSIKPLSRELLEEYAEKIKVPFRICVHPNTITKEVAKLLARAGCWEVEMGVQTTNKEGRNMCGRTEDNEMIKNAVKNLKNVGIRTLADCITYMPGDNSQISYQTASDLSMIKPYRVIAYTLRYYPRTEIIKYAIEYGLLNQSDVDDIEEGNYKGSMKLTSLEAKKDKALHKLAGIIMLSPYISKETIRFLEKINAERWMPDIGEVVQFLNQIRSLFDKHHDVARTARKRYTYYLTKKNCW